MDTCEITIGGKKFYVTFTDREMAPMGLRINGSLFRLSEEPNGRTVGCITMYRTQTLAAVWSPPIASRNLLDKLYLRILPHINIDIAPEKIPDMYSKCFPIVIGTGNTDNLGEDEMSIGGGENAEALVKRLVYGGTYSNPKIREEILQYLYDYYWNQSHTTKVLVSDIQQFFFIPKTLFDPNLDYLIRKNLVEPLHDASKQLVSVSLSQEGVEYVELGFQDKPSVVQVIQNMGDQINTTINGNSNVVNIKGELNQFFVSLEAEIETKNEDNRKEVLGQVSELKAELEGEKDFNKIQAILSKLKDSAGWVHEKIIKHPVFSQVLAQAVASKIGL